MLAEEPTTSVETTTVAESNFPTLRIINHSSIFESLLAKFQEILVMHLKLSDHNYQ
ncbi:hypothetical protein ABLV90_06105 [Staphylococcus sp. 2S1]